MISFDLVNFPKILLIGRRICAGDWRYTQFIIQNYEFVFVYQGEACFTLNDRTHVLYPGDFILLKPNQVFSSTTNPDNPCKYYVIHFQPNNPVNVSAERSASLQIMEAIQSVNYKEIHDVFEMPQINFKRVYLSDNIALGNSRETMFTILEKAIAERNRLNLSSELMLSCYLCEIFILLSRLTIENLKIDFIFNHANDMSRTIQEALYFIHDNYASPITLHDICKHVDVSPQYLIRIFRRELNKSPLQYMNLFRIARAKNMLTYTSLIIKEISSEVGIQNPYYFSRLFKKIEGITPTEYRTKACDFFLQLDPSERER